MTKTNEFRIVEQLGKFFLERKYIEDAQIPHNFWTKKFPFLFKPKFCVKIEHFYKLDSRGYYCQGVICKPIGFNSYDEALKFYNSLNPKYYPIEKTE